VNSDNGERFALEDGLDWMMSTLIGMLAIGQKIWYWNNIQTPEIQNLPVSTILYADSKITFILFPAFL